MASDRALSQASGTSRNDEDDLRVPLTAQSSIGDAPRYRDPFQVSSDDGLTPYSRRQMATASQLQSSRFNTDTRAGASRYSDEATQRDGASGGAPEAPPPVDVHSSLDTMPLLQTGQLWGTNIMVNDFRNSFREFLETFKVEGALIYINMIQDLLRRGQVDLHVDGHHLLEFDAHLYSQIVMYPADCSYLMDFVVTDVAQTDENRSTLVCRVFNLRDPTTLRSLSPANLEQLVSLSGMVTRTSKIIPEIIVGNFSCVDCFAVHKEQIHRNRIYCPPACVKCGAKFAYKLRNIHSAYESQQIVKIQEPPESVPEGETPQTISICVFDNLVDYANPGDRIVITGIFRATPSRLKSTQRATHPLFKTYIECMHISKKNEQALDAKAYLEPEDSDHITDEDRTLAESISSNPDYNIYDLLVKSFAPSIFAQPDVKKGLLCQLVGGTHKTWQNARVRGDINVLLCGDPGVAKSQLLQFVNKVAPRGVMTTGRGTSSVGLTAYLTRDADSGEMVLESGALVLSDRGVCCIDEFDKMAEGTTTILHEVMEQQTISVAKAGIVCTLNARASVLAAANPKQSKWNFDMTVAENINLQPTILSRFDLVYVLLDRQDIAFDENLARHIVNLYSGADFMRDVSRGGILSAKHFSKYISYARAAVRPKISDDARGELARSYTRLREESVRRGTFITTRHLESLIRISEAQAKLRLHTVVDISHVKEAVRLFETVGQASS